MLLSLLISFAASAAAPAQVTCQTWHEAVNGRVQVDCHNHEVRGFVDLKTAVTGIKVIVSNSKTGMDTEKVLNTKLTLADVLKNTAAFQKKFDSAKSSKHEKVELLAVTLPSDTQLFGADTGSKMMAQNLNSTKKIDRFVASEKAAPQAGGVRGKKK